MRIEFHDLVKEYYNTTQFKDMMSYEEFLIVCKAPFYYIRSQMERETMPDIYIKFFATLRVSVPRMKNMLRDNEKDSKFKSITPKQYEQRKAHYHEIVDRISKNSEITSFELIDDEED